jgi:hypothetical protein
MAYITIFGTHITAVAALAALAGIVGVAGCDSCHATAAGADAGESADVGTDSATGPDTAPPDTDAGCDKHLPAGFTQVVVSPGLVASFTGSTSARTQAMVLDENDDPMFAYGSLDSSSSYSINFLRWDPCAGQFTTPIVVETLHSFTASPDVSLAYDPTTKEIAIAYVKGVTFDNWADSTTEIWLATMKSPATSFTLQPLSVAEADYYGANAPSIAMAQGKIAVAYGQGEYPGGNVYIWLLTNTTTPSQPTIGNPPIAAGAVDGGADAGPPPPHYFAYTAVPFPSGEDIAPLDYAYPTFTSGTIGVAIDSNGVPGVAAYEAKPGSSQQLLFWRAGTPDAISVYTFSEDGPIDVSLVFDGAKPRIAGHMDTPSAADLDTLAFVASEDGVTWSKLVHLPNNDGAQVTSFDSALAIGGPGLVAVAANINGGGGGMPCGRNPYVATTSIDDGSGVWQACGADATGVHAYSSASSVSALYGASRLSGTLVVSFGSGASAATDAGANQGGLIYWQHE